MRHLRSLLLLGALAEALVMAGCNAVPNLAERTGLDQGPIYQPVNFRGESRLPADIRRVALLPIYGGVVAGPESASALDPVLLTALQQQNRFEVVVVSRADCHRLFGAEEFSSVAALPPGFLDNLAKLYAVDAVMFTDLTVYRAYRPLSLGFRSKLASTRDVRLVWAFDEVFTADDPRMRNSVRSYYHRGDRNAPFDAMQAALQSPLRFGAVAAEIMCQTLPPR
jgi:hypothetical protein